MRVQHIADGIDTFQSLCGTKNAFFLTRESHLRLCRRCLSIASKNGLTIKEAQISDEERECRAIIAWNAMSFYKNDYKEQQMWGDIFNSLQLSIPFEWPKLVLQDLYRIADGAR